MLDPLAWLGMLTAAKSLWDGRGAEGFPDSCSLDGRWGCDGSYLGLPVRIVLVLAPFLLNPVSCPPRTDSVTRSDAYGANAHIGHPVILHVTRPL